MDEPQHCCQQSNDQFAVSHGDWGTKESGVCIVDSDGRVVQSYGEARGSGVGQMKGARHMTVDRHDHVMVADCGNDRIELLSPRLTHLGYITIPGYELDMPWALHLDDLNHRLYIGELGGGRLFVLDARISENG